MYYIRPLIVAEDVSTIFPKHRCLHAGLYDVTPDIVTAERTPRLTVSVPTAYSRTDANITFLMTSSKLAQPIYVMWLYLFRKL